MPARVSVAGQALPELNRSDEPVAGDVGSVGEKDRNQAEARLVAMQVFGDSVGQVMQAPGSSALPRSVVERHGATLAVDRGPGEVEA